MPAFCPHPSWLYPNLDRTYVMHAAAVRVAERAEPGMPLAVGALPVRDGFASASAAGRGQARARLGLEQGKLTALVTTGSFGFGKVERTVRAVLGAGPGTRVIVFCGRNEALRRHLAGTAWHGDIRRRGGDPLIQQDPAQDDRDQRVRGGDHGEHRGDQRSGLEGVLVEDEPGGRHRGDAEEGSGRQGRAYRPQPSVASVIPGPLASDTEPAVRRCWSSP